MSNHTGGMSRTMNRTTMPTRSGRTNVPPRTSRTGNQADCTIAATIVLVVANVIKAGMSVPSM